MKCVNVSTELHELAKEFARQKGFRLSLVYNRALEEYLKNNQGSLPLSPGAPSPADKNPHTHKTESKDNNYGARAVIEDFLNRARPKTINFNQIKKILLRENFTSPTTHNTVWDWVLAHYKIMTSISGEKPNKTEDHELIYPGA